MNTRIQVEHTVTEMITGVDLVQAQLELAMNDVYNFDQSKIKVNGHAMQCRINAEDPKSFVPSPGRIMQIHRPGGYHVRFESQIYSGYDVPAYYDSLIAEIIVKDLNRDRVLNKMKMALDETVIEGIKTNVDLHRRLVTNDDFREYRHYIKFLEEKMVNDDE